MKRENPFKLVTLEPGSFPEVEEVVLGSTDDGSVVDMLVIDMSRVSFIPVKGLERLKNALGKIKHRTRYIYLIVEDSTLRSSLDLCGISHQTVVARSFKELAAHSSPGVTVIERYMLLE